MRTSFRILMSLSLVGTLGGCGLFPPTLVDRDIVRLDIEQTWPIHVSMANVFREEGKTVVRGEVRAPFWRRHTIFRGHVDIALALPDGSTVIRHDVRLEPRSIPDGHGRRATFVSRFDIDPPRGTLVRIGYNASEHAKAK